MNMANGQRQVESIDRKKKALEMRIAGASYEAIAQELGYRSRSGAYQAVMTALKRTLQEPANELRTLEVRRLDEMLADLWGKRKQPLVADRILRIMERRAKLLGLDAPTKWAPTDPTGEKEYIGLTDEERMVKIQAILEMARKREALDGIVPTQTQTE
jgi:hypothetical protein